MSITMDTEKMKKKYSENDMALIEFDDCSRDIVGITELNNGNFHSINIGKKYSFKFDNKWNLVRVKFIGNIQTYLMQFFNSFKKGSCEDCHKEFEKISEMAESENQKVSQSDLSNDPNLEKSKNYNLNNEYYLDRLKELENALIEKELKIRSLEKQLKEQEEINNALKNTYCEKDIGLLRDLSINFLKIFGNKEETIQNEIVANIQFDSADLSILSKNYPEISLPPEIRYKVQSYLSNPNETASSAFRKVITALIPDSEEWATSNRILLVEKYKNEVHASYEYVKKFKPNFDYNAAEAELRKIASERRRDLKKLGYVFETYKELNETFCRYRIVNRPYVSHNNNLNSHEIIPNTSQSFIDNDYYDENYNDDAYPLDASVKRQKLCDSESEE